MNDRFLPNLAARIWDTPLMIHPDKLQVIVSALGARIGARGVVLPDVPDWALAPAAASASSNNETPRGLRNVRGVAVIDVIGTLVHRPGMFDAVSGLTSYERIGNLLDHAARDASVHSILLLVDSPGGEVSGVFELADRIRETEKPVYALAADMAASAAYALAAAADQVFVSQASFSGSIGVVLARWDESAMLEDAGVRITLLHAGARKIDGNSVTPMTDDEQAALQALVDRQYGIFVDKIAAFRGLEPAAVRATEAGLFVGGDAVAAGLADGVSTLEALIERLNEESGGPRTAPSTQGGIQMDKQEKTTVTTQAELEEAFPELVGALRQEATEAGASAERARIKAILDLQAPGHEDFVHEQAFEPAMTADSVSRQILEREAGKRGARLSALKKDEEDLDAPAADVDSGLDDGDRLAAQALELHRSTMGRKAAPAH